MDTKLSRYKKAIVLTAILTAIPVSLRFRNPIQSSQSANYKNKTLIQNPNYSQLNKDYEK